MNSCPQCLNDTNPGTQCPAGRQNLPYFAEIVINHNLVIPDQKPDVELIANVTKNFRIEDVEVLDVDLGDVQGRKLIIAGTLTLGFEYSAAVPSQEVHYAHFDIPFEAIIKARPCPGDFRGLLPPDFNISRFNIRICVEHEQYHLVSPREISKVLVVLLWLEPIPVDLAVTKTGPATATVNTNVHYDVTVTNNGPIPATGVTLVDTVEGNALIDTATLPANCTAAGNVITCNIGNLAVGASSAIGINITPFTADTTVTDIATVTGDQPDPNPANNTAEVTTTVTP